MGKNRGNEPQLPPFVDDVIGFFEGFAKKRVSFLWVEVPQEHGCMFCARPTDLRLQAKVEGEVIGSVICHECKDAIADAPMA